MKLAIYILNLWLDSMNLTMVQVFIATNCKFNHYTFFGRAMHWWRLNDSLSFGKKTEMIDNTRLHWNDNIKSIKTTLFSNFNGKTGGILIYHFGMPREIDFLLCINTWMHKKLVFKATLLTIFCVKAIYFYSKHQKQSSFSVNSCNSVSGCSI